MHSVSSTYRYSLLLILCTICVHPLQAIVEPVRIVSTCDTEAEWGGGTADLETKHHGRAAIRWNHGEFGSLQLRVPPTDWTDGNAFRFWVHNQTAGDNTFMVIVRSENPETEGMDYWMHRVHLDFEGWKSIILRRKTMGGARRPLGWDHVSGFFFAADGWEQTLDPNTVVHIDQLEIVDMIGPRVSDEELLDAIDLSRPELAAVRHARQTGRLEDACSKLAETYRNRASVGWFFDPHSVDRSIGYSEERAEKTLEGTFTVINIEHTFADGDIDWFYNPTIERDDLAANREWQWQLGRMHYWGDLGRAYWATGDERYAETFVQQLRSWARHCPRPDSSGNTANSAWRTIECGIRMGGSWPTAYHRFLHSPSFTDADLCLFLKVCYEHAMHLLEHRTSGNWLTMEMSGLYTVGALFPEFRDAEVWRNTAAKALFDELDTQFLPDGAQVELTTGYHQVALGNVLKIPRIAEVTGTLGELPDDYIQRTEKAFDFNLKLMTPGRDLPTFNDAWHVNVPRTLRQTLTMFPQRQDFRWIATDGQEGTRPNFTSVLLPYAGYAAMRSGWERDATYIAFDGGLLGYGHVHQDKLNMVMCAFGRQILYDGGGGSYESSKWRRYATDTFSHNTVLVDGKPQRRGSRDRWDQVAKEPLPIRWHTSSEFDYVAADYNKGYGDADNQPATHTRRILFIKPDIVLVADLLTPHDNEAHTYQARWHLRSTETAPLNLTGGIVTTDPDQPNLAVVPLLTEGLDVKAASAQEEPEILGWEVLKNAGRRPSTTLCHTTRGTGTKLMLTLLLPLRPHQDFPIAASEQQDIETAIIRFVDNSSLLVRITDEGIDARLTDAADDKVKRIIHTR